jgi:hypothetical protein
LIWLIERQTQQQQDFPGKLSLKQSYVFYYSKAQP